MRGTVLIFLWLLTVTPEIVARPQNANVNDRYFVESVDLQPLRTASLSRALRADLKKVVGEHLNQSLLDSLRERIKAETGAITVQQNLTKGTGPDRVKVVFVIQRKNERHFDIEIPKLTYYSGQGWSAGADALVSNENYQASFGVTNDGDQLIERFAGIHGSVERKNLIGRLNLRFEVRDYHSQWNASTLAAVGEGSPGIYRVRRVFQPVASVRLLGPLEYSFGVSFQNLEMQFPAARTEAAHAVLQTLRLTRRWRDSDVQQTVEAGYSLRAATSSLGSDFSYNRHQFDAGYELAYGRHGLELRFIGGTLNGDAPLFDRFVAGNSSVMRGWNKFEINPTGARRLAAGAATYRYRWIHAYYDVGSAWNPGEGSAVRHSLGVGLQSKRGPFLSVAFPLRDSGMFPVFFLGLNF